MVSGLVTSPCDQLRIFSGDARLIRMESKSVIEVPRSNGLERYKVCPPTAFTPPWRLPVLFGYAFCLSSRPEAHRNWTIGKNLVGSRCHLLAAAFNTLDQLHIETERLQLADQNVEGLRDARFNGGLTFHNGLINLGAAKDVV